MKTLLKKVVGKKAGAVGAAGAIKKALDGGYGAEMQKLLQRPGEADARPAPTAARKRATAPARRAVAPVRRRR